MVPRNETVCGLSRGLEVATKTVDSAQVSTAIIGANCELVRDLSSTLNQACSGELLKVLKVLR